ncbi:SLC13 family permease [uncultured Ilyobacter sp.]|uniref:SLC13 family permease n=1 Tax=uncultured Ilyobacter sp. TaxID=544433 RepID=UPI0029F49101|nr:SLC13 family permease [uncultured Ilyobacter sp.]
MDHALITIIILLFAAVMFIWEKLPLSVTAMIVALALTLTGVITPQEAFAGFVNKNVILFCAMFVVGGALFQTGMASKIGGLVTKFAKSERQLMAAIMIVVGLLSGLLSNTGTAAILMPVVIGICAKSGFSRSRLLMPLMLAAAMGGNMTLIGAPGNMIADSTLQKMFEGSSFGFFEFAKIGLPILTAGTIFFVLVGYKFLPERTDVKEETDDTSDIVENVKVVPEWKQYTSLAILVLTIVAMVFQKQIGIKLHIIGSIGALLLVVTGVMTEKEAFESIDLKTIFLFGGILPLAGALNNTGAGKMIAEAVTGFLGADSSPMVVLAVIFLLAAVLTNFMSNTATTALLAPIGVSIAQKLGADPRAVLMAIVIGGSCAYATPIGMPANAMIYGPGGYKFNDYVKSGLPLIGVSFVVSMILLPIFWPLFP